MPNDHGLNDGPDAYSAGKSEQPIGDHFCISHGVGFQLRVFQNQRTARNDVVATVIMPINARKFIIHRFAGSFRCGLLELFRSRLALLLPAAVPSSAAHAFGFPWTLFSYLLAAALNIWGAGWLSGLCLYRLPARL